MMLVVCYWRSNSSRASISSESFIFSEASSVNSISISLISFLSLSFFFSEHGIEESLISFILFFASSLSFSLEEIPRPKLFFSCWLI